MKTAICSALAGVALLASATAAGAAEPVKLSDAQMDGVTASGAAAAMGGAATLGDLVSDTAAATQTMVIGSEFAAAQAESTGLAVSVFFPGASSSASQAAATLP
jgi:hypothetical protein